MKKLLTLYICAMLMFTSFVGIPLLTEPVKSGGTNNGSGSDGSTGVNPATGTFQTTLPLLNIPGRGVDVQINLRYNSQIWQADPDGPEEIDPNDMIGIPEPFEYNRKNQLVEDYSITGLGFELGIAELYGVRYFIDPGISEPAKYWYRFSFEDPMGRHILFGSDNPNYENGRDNRFIAIDTSGATLFINHWEGTGADSYPTTFTVVLADGLRYHFNSSTALLGRDGSGFGPSSPLLEMDSGDGSGSGIASLRRAERLIKIPNMDMDWFTFIHGVPFDVWTEFIQSCIDSGRSIPFLGGWHYTPSPPRPVVKTGTASWAYNAIEDPNGNTIQINYYDHPAYDDPARVLALPKNITDTYGRMIYFETENETEMIQGNQSYPKCRLTEIHTNISANGEPYRIQFNYQEENDDPYIIIHETGGPFGEYEGCHQWVPWTVNTQKGNTDAARTRIILESITIDPTGEDIPPWTTTFGYNEFYELNSITLPFGGSKTLNYDTSRKASCYSGDVYGGQWIRVANQVTINDGSGHSSLTEYQYQIHTNENEEPDHICFSNVTEYHHTTNTRIEYNYYSDTPDKIFTTSPCFLSAILAGLLHTTKFYEGDNQEPLKEGQIFYSGVYDFYNHQIYPHDDYGNIWNFISPMGFTTQQEGQSRVLIIGVDANPHPYNDDEFLGFRTYWTIQDDEYQDAEQYTEGGYSTIPPTFNITLTNPQHATIQKITINENNPNYEEYCNRGLWQLVTKTEYGEADIWNPYLTPLGFITIEGYAGAYFRDEGWEDYPFSYNVILTTEIEYDGETLLPPGDIPNGMAGSYVDPETTYRGLITKQQVIETGEYTENKYYRNGLLARVYSYIDIDDFGSTTKLEYGNNGVRPNHWGMLSKTSVETNTYDTLNTEFEHNPLGQITRIEDVDNNYVEESTYDGFGRLLNHAIEGNTVSTIVYQDDPGAEDGIYIETTTIAGPNPEDKTITRTYYDGLYRPFETLERSGNEQGWKTSTQVIYNNAGQIERSYLPMPYDDINPEIRYNSYEYDSLGRVTKTTDVLGRELTSSVLFGQDIDQTLYEAGVRTAARITGSWGAERIDYMDARGLTLISKIKINNDDYATKNFYYDNGSRLWKEVSPEGLETYGYYDSIGRLVAVDTPDETADFPLVPGQDFQFPDQGVLTQGASNPVRGDDDLHVNEAMINDNVQQTRDNAYTLTLDVGEGGSATVDPLPDGTSCSYPPGTVIISGYSPNTEVTLTAYPAPGWYFCMWEGDLPSGDVENNPVYITMDSDKDITATFMEHTYHLTVDVDGAGDVIIDPEQEWYSDEYVELTAVSDEGWTFNHWSSSDVDFHGSTMNHLTVLMDEDKTFTAHFTKNADVFIEEFNLAGQPLQIRDSHGWFHLYYDELGRTTSVKHSDTRDGPQTTIEEHSYDPGDALWTNNAYGKLAKSTYHDLENEGLTYSVTFGYDTFGRILAIRYELGDCPSKTVYFGYDWLGRPTSIIYPEGDVLSYNYVGSGLTTIKLNNKVLVGAEYDEFRRLDKLSLGDDIISTNFVYDDLTDRLDAFSVIKRSSGFVEQHQSNDLDGMNEAQAFNEIKENKDSIFLQPDGEKQQQQHDIVDPREPISVNLNLLTEQYEYDSSSGELIGIRDADDALKRGYTYDLMGRLVSAELYNVDYVEADESFVSSPGDMVTIDYGWDRDGLRVSKSIEYDDTQGGRGTVRDQHTYNYVSDTHRLDNVTRWTETGDEIIFSQEFDNSGSVTSYDGDAIMRDYLGQITNYNNEEWYGYMGGVRVRRTNDDGETTYNLCLGKDAIAEYNENGTLLRNHYYGFTGRLATDEAGPDGLVYLISDRHGDLRLIIDDNNNVIWTGEYTPFGELIGNPQPVGQEGFDGYLHENTGLTHAFARDYNEKTGTYLSIDPMNSVDSPYTYCYGNPISLRDPMGLDPEGYWILIWLEGTNADGMPEMIPVWVYVMNPVGVTAEGPSFGGFRGPDTSLGPISGLGSIPYPSSSSSSSSSSGSYTRFSSGLGPSYGAIGGGPGGKSSGGKSSGGGGGGGSFRFGKRTFEWNTPKHYWRYNGKDYVIYHEKPTLNNPESEIQIKQKYAPEAYHGGKRFTPSRIVNAILLIYMGYILLDEYAHFLATDPWQSPPSADSSLNYIPPYGRRYW